MDNPTFIFAPIDDLHNRCKQYNKIAKEKILPQDFMPVRKTLGSVGYDLRIFDVECLDLEDLKKEQFDSAPITDDFSWFIPPFARIKINLGLKVLSPEGWWLWQCSRSGAFINDQFVSLEGKIDTDYEGNLCLLTRYVPSNIDPLYVEFFHSHAFSESFQDVKEVYIKEYIRIPRMPLEFGQRVAQILPMPVYTMNIQRLSEKELQKKFDERQGSRKKGGFGSSGKF